MASLRSWWEFAAKAFVLATNVSGEVARKLVRSRVKIAARVCEFPRGRAQKCHKYERPDCGLCTREKKMADPPPKITRSRLPPATQATPW